MTLPYLREGPTKVELTKNLSNICDWFVDNKLSIHFGEDKTKLRYFSQVSNRDGVVLEIYLDHKFQ